MLMRMLMACRSAERGRVTGGTVTAIGWSIGEILGDLFTGKGNREKPGLSAGMGPSDLGGLYAPKRGTLSDISV